MLLHNQSEGGGTLLAAHVSDFSSVLAARRWRHNARNELPEVAGLVFAKAMPFIGSRASAGFGGGVPGIGCQVLLTAWREESDFDQFLDLPLAQGLRKKHSCWSLLDVASTAGSFYGSAPLSGGDEVGDGPFATLTLGRVRVRSLPRFLREGARLGSFTEHAPGLVSAVSAGWPPTGNCTLSIWESEQHMLGFAYGDADGHGDTVRRDPPILVEQLRARLRVRRLGGDWGRGPMYPERLTQLAGALG